MKNEISKSLRNEAKDRKKMMEEVTNNLDSYSFRILELENKIKEYELEEIKYKNIERESKELTKIYESKLEEKDKLLIEKEDENKKIKKELMNEQTIHNNLKSMLEVIVNRYTIEEISEISGLSVNKIKEYLK